MISRHKIQLCYWNLQANLIITMILLECSLLGKLCTLIQLLHMLNAWLDPFGNGISWACHWFFCHPYRDHFFNCQLYMRPYIFIPQNSKSLIFLPFSLMWCDIWALPAWQRALRTSIGHVKWPFYPCCFSPSTHWHMGLTCQLLLLPPAITMQQRKKKFLERNNADVTGRDNGDRLPFRSVKGFEMSYQIRLSCFAIWIRLRTIPSDNLHIPKYSFWIICHLICQYALSSLNCRSLNVIASLP